jgi:hypothetical protein
MGYCKIGNYQCEKPWFGDVWGTCILGTPWRASDWHRRKTCPICPISREGFELVPMEFMRIHTNSPYSSTFHYSSRLCMFVWKLLCGDLEWKLTGWFRRFGNCRDASATHFSWYTRGAIVALGVGSWIVMILNIAYVRAYVLWRCSETHQILGI